MKAYTHPKRNSTLIQRKDGRSYIKNWVYFRSILRSDNDEKIWKSFTSQIFFDKKISDVKTKTSNKNSNIFPNLNY